MHRLDGKVAFITGAGGGIGRAVSARFLEEGASVIATDLHAQGAEEAVASAIEGKALALACDVSDSEQVRGAVRAGVKTFGSLHVLVSIAGGSTSRDGRVTEVADEEFWRVIGLDLFGTFSLCKHGIPELIRSGGGSVINLTSVTAIRGIPDKVAYSSAKGGIAAMTRAMAVGHASDRVRVNAIAPGVTLTPRVLQFLETREQTRRDASRHPLGPVDPVQVANMALYLASDESQSVTGQVLVVDGGFTIA